MATVLLSISTNTFSGVWWASASGALTRRSVHPAAPVLLTKSGKRSTKVEGPRPSIPWWVIEPPAPTPEGKGELGTRRRTEEEAAPSSALRVEVLDCTGPVPSKASSGSTKEGGCRKRAPRQAARVARAETRSKLSNSMMMESPAVSLKLWMTFKNTGESCAGVSLFLIRDKLRRPESKF